MRRLALYTTVYPGIEKYLYAWYESVLAQTDHNFDLWIGVDQLSIDDVVKAIGIHPSAAWVMAAKDDSPVRIREKAIQRMVHEYSAIVFVDSDDMLEPTRVEAARRSLEKTDVSACAMRIIDDSGQDLGITFGPPHEMDLTTILPRNNVFGLSNTVYRSETLARCLPIPGDCTLVDWYLVTLAWALGARLDFDFSVRMAYRQYAENVAHVLPPFTASQVLLDTKRVLKHYSCVLEHLRQLRPEPKDMLETAYRRVKEFNSVIMNQSALLDRYVNALNGLPIQHMWWTWVANSELEEIWRN